MTEKVSRQCTSVRSDVQGNAEIPCWGLGGMEIKPQIDDAGLSTSFLLLGLQGICVVLRLRAEVDVPME